MSGRFGKYGDFKRKVKLRQSGLSKGKSEKMKLVPKGPRRPKKKKIRKRRIP